MIPHVSNTRSKLLNKLNEDKEWVGFEQEYTLFDNGCSLWYPKDDETAHKVITIVAETWVKTFQENI